MLFQMLNSDQGRELVNSRQRLDAWREARERARSFRGSLIWADRRGKPCLLRSYYDEATGRRKQKLLGVRNEQTEALAQKLELMASEARDTLASRQAALRRQTGINRALGLGRIPASGAKVIGALDNAGLMGRGVRIAGTHAIYAYEAAAGVFVENSLTSTDDIDVLFDARVRLRFSVEEGIADRTILEALRKADRSFTRSQQTYRAVNKDGFMVDLIKPMGQHPWTQQENAMKEGDLVAVEIEGLAWQENAPPFEAVAIGQSGDPVRLVAPDPRVFAIHKHWLSTRADREPIRRRRDAAQAKAVAALVTRFFPHLPFDMETLRMLPREIVIAAAPLFVEA